MDVPIATQQDRLRAVLEHHSEIGLSYLFGSTARGTARPDSDLDVAVAGRRPVSPATKLELIDQLAAMSGRPVDLALAPPPLLRHVLTTGMMCHKSDSSLYADLLRKLWYDQADIMPNYELVLRKRREEFVRG